tara:strand:+ start:532 stop:750 length:219 start_codon:yes stop_codon:yes gene_type:complete
MERKKVIEHIVKKSIEERKKVLEKKSISPSAVAGAAAGASGGGSGIPTEAAEILLETGASLLLEDGSKILLQ